MSEQTTFGRPRGILLDLGGTVLQQSAFDPEAGLRRVRELVSPGVSSSLAAADPSGTQFWEALQERRRQLRTDGNIEVTVRQCLQEWMLRCSLSSNGSLADLELEYWKAASSMAPEAGIVAALELLAELQIPVGLVSNSVFGAHVILWELEKHDLARRFRFAIASADFGYRKPHAGLFHSAARKLNLQPHEIWFIGDSLEDDVRGAEAAGMTPLWYRSTPQPPTDMPKVAVLADWSMLGPLLSRIIHDSSP